MARARTARLVFVVLATATTALLIAGCDWAQFGYGPEHTRASADSGISRANVGTLQPAWTGGTGCSGSPVSCTPLWSSATTGFFLTSSPTIANGRV